MRKWVYVLEDFFQTIEELIKQKSFIFDVVIKC